VFSYLVIIKSMTHKAPYLIRLVLNQSKMGPCKLVFKDQFTRWSEPNKHTFSKFEHELTPCTSFGMERGTGGNVNVGL
jgi:hypothetical protein